jgi:two-component system, NtrC family, sensor kinase
MPIKRKILLILCGVLGLFVLATYGIFEGILVPAFGRLELGVAQRNMARVSNAIDNELSHLARVAADWGRWDDTYAFVADPRPAYVASNLMYATFTSLGIHALYIHDLNGRLVWGRTYDLETGLELPLPELAGGLPATSQTPQPAESGPAQARTDLLHTSLGPMLIATQPILNSEENLPSRGTLVMGRLLNDASAAALSRQAQVSFRFWVLDDRSTLPPEIADIVAAPPGAVPMAEADAERLWTYARLPALNGAGILLRTETPRDIARLAREGIELALLALIAAGTSMLLILFALIGREVIRPLTRLHEHMGRIGETPDLEERLDLNRRDELGALADQFNALLDRLAKARHQLMENYYRAGMADLAAGVLHNIRNTMSPMVSRLQRMLTTLQHSPGNRGIQALDELVRDHLPAGRPAQLARYARLSLEQSAEQRAAFQREIEEALRQTETVEQILQDHERIGQGRRPVERVQVDELVRDALRISLQDHAQEILVEIDESVRQAPRVMGQRIVLIQVLSNLVNNACAALEGSGQGDKRIGFSAAVAVCGEREFLDLCCRDQGIGMDRGDLARIFERGYTHKPNGSGGLGLHWCANALALMGGSIRAESDGLGQGARLHLLLPLATDERAA